MSWDLLWIGDIKNKLSSTEEYVNTLIEGIS